MKAQNKQAMSKRNYYVDIAILFPFVFLLFTGIVMLRYHAGMPTSETLLGNDAHFWLNTHIFSAIASFVMIVVHLSLHLGWFKKVFSGSIKNKYWIRNLVLVILFLLTILTSAVPWLFLQESSFADALLGIHNKLGLLLIVFFAIHLLGYSRWLINMTKRVFVNNFVGYKRDVG